MDFLLKLILTIESLIRNNLSCLYSIGTMRDIEIDY